MLEHLAPRYAPIETALGPGYFAYTANGVAMISAKIGERDFVAEVTRTFGVRPVRRDPPRRFLDRVRASMKRGDGSAVDWSLIPPFQRKVLEATAAIPAGEVRSYGDVAHTIGAPRAQRAVGTALARNPVPFLIPCHRVVGGDGARGHYGMGGTRAKRILLGAEGYSGS